MTTETIAAVQAATGAKPPRRTAATIPPPVDPMDTLVAPAQAYALAGFGSVKALERARRAGTGPAFYQVNQRVIRYRVRDLIEYRERFRVETAA